MHLQPAAEAMLLAGQEGIGAGGLAFAAGLGVDAGGLDRAGIAGGDLGRAAQGVLEDDGAHLAARQHRLEVLEGAAVQVAADQQPIAVELQVRRGCAGRDDDQQAHQDP